MTEISTSTTPSRGRGFAAYLLITAALSGALVMVVEVLGSRVIGPYFGVSLFVWTALITVTLLSLSIGYDIGGRLADRRPSPDWLYGLIIAAGLLVALVPVLKSPVIQASSVLGLRAGALLAATLLFGPALLLLGCVSPYVVRVAAADWARLGRTVGLFYAVSTAGSFVGTALTGFFIIAYIGVSKAFYLCGFLLVLIGVIYYVAFRQRAVALVALMPFLLTAFGTAALPSVRMPDGTQVSLIDHGDSFYGNVKVVEYEGTAGRTREMMIDGLIQGGIDQLSGQSVYEYPYLMEHLPLAVKPDIRSALFIGLGPGAVVNAYQQRGIQSDVVDIDPLVVHMAEKHFFFRPQRPVIVADGRTVLREAGPQYDAILMDVFNGDITPGHLLSKEAIAQVRGRLSPDGVFAMNLIGSLAPDARLLPAMVRTLRTQFREVIAFPLFDTSKPETASGNLVILASNSPLVGALSLRQIPGVHPLAAAGVHAALAQSMRLPDHADALLLSDDYNPLDVFEADLHEGVRRAILETTPAAILLHS
jgi:spermidine synthase